jgi:hypothetical protein
LLYFFSYIIAKPIQTNTRRNKLVELPAPESTVPTLIVCDIQPGALVQSYSVQWFRVIQSVSLVHEGETRFELTLNVTSSLNGSQHVCVVTVNHDGYIRQNYSGGIITIQVMVIYQMELHLTQLGISTAGILSVICVAIILVIGIGCCIKSSAHRKTHQVHNKSSTQQTDEGPIEMYTLARTISPSKISNWGGIATCNYLTRWQYSSSSRTTIYK